MLNLKNKPFAFLTWFVYNFYGRKLGKEMKELIHPIVFLSYVSSSLKLVSGFLESFVAFDLFKTMFIVGYLVFNLFFHG